MTLGRLLIAVLLAGVPSAPGAAIRYVANNGIDSTFCGVTIINGFTCSGKETPCRSISCAIREADAGDLIIVGPGRYGDLNRDGALDDKGDEFGLFGGSCDCMIAVHKAVTIVSSHGAGATLIDASTVDLFQNVRITPNGGEFGRPGKGFLVTGTASADFARSHGIVVDGGTNLRIRGNQLDRHGAPAHRGYGIWVIDDGPGTVLIEENQVLGAWDSGISIRGTGSRTVRRNHVAGSTVYGIVFYQSGAGTIVGNVVTGSGFVGIYAQDSTLVPTVSGNAAYGNDEIGIELENFDGGVAQKNNVFGNGECGMHVEALVTPAIASNNYWGASTGPGADPADEICFGDGYVPPVIVPFATKPFSIDPPLRP